MKYNDGTDHTIEPVNGVYSFTMPKTDVTISADIEHTLYSINVDESITHGSVSAAVGETQNAKTAYYGDDVTLTVTPNDGYLIDSVTYNDGTDHTITHVDGNYSFTMPESNVTISATFVPDPTHFSQDGDTYTIHDETGWNVFCDCLDDNATYNRFSGKTVKLDADITVSRSAGYNSHDFCGTFDGQGHTLTFNYGTSDNYADVENISPFSYVSNTKANPDDTENSPVTIKDLHVKGDIYTTKNMPQD